MQRQAPNVGRMRLLGATVVPVTSGDRTLRAAIDEALRDWVSDPTGTYYLLGSAVGGIPIRTSCASCRRSSGARRARRCSSAPARCPMRSSPASAAAPTPSACSTLSSPIAASRSSASRPAAAARASARTRRRWPTAGPGCCTAAIRCCCRIDDGQIQETHSVSAGLDYPGVGPGARAAAADRPRALRGRERCRGARGGARMLRVRRHPAGARERARARRRRRWAAAHPGRAHPGRPVSGRGDKDMPTLDPGAAGPGTEARS